LKSLGTVLKLLFLEEVPIKEPVLSVEHVEMETEETEFAPTVSAAHNMDGAVHPQLIAVVVELVEMETVETESAQMDSAALNGDGAELHQLIAVASVVFEVMRHHLIVKKN
jgi:hypothetical protein